MDWKLASPLAARLIALSYGEGYEVSLVQAHPSAQLGIERVFDLWRSHRGKEKLVIIGHRSYNRIKQVLVATVKTNSQESFTHVVFVKPTGVGAMTDHQGVHHF